MLNVAMLSYHTCPLETLGGKDTGGMNVYVRELTHHLGKMGVHVDVFTRSQNEHVPHVLHDLGYGNRVVHVPSGPEPPAPKASCPNTYRSSSRASSALPTRNTSIMTWCTAITGFQAWPPRRSKSAGTCPGCTCSTPWG